MAPPEVNHLFHRSIIDHSFSADRRTLAVTKENKVELYGKSGSSYQLKDELTGHDKTVTGVDIAPKSGKIVTCSQGKLLEITLNRTKEFQIEMHMFGNHLLKEV